MRPTSPLIERVLGDEIYYRNGPPIWKDVPEAGDAREARDACIRRLRRFSSDFAGAAQLADTLDQCASRRRCMSGACPECLRAFQRWFVSQVVEHATAADPGELHSISVIFSEHSAAEDQLASLDTTNMKRSVSEAIKNLDDLEWIAGGIDLSLNDDAQKGHGVYWQPQLYAIVYGNVATLSEVLRNKYVRSETVSRPVQIKDCDGFELAVSYAFKTYFNRRIAYQREVGPPEKRRTCWHTRKVSLRPPEHVQAMLWMHQIGLGGRLYLRGVRMTRVRAAVELVQIKKLE